MRVSFVCRSYLSQGDAVPATETDMGGIPVASVAFLFESGRTMHCTAPLAFSQNNNVVKGDSVRPECKACCQGRSEI